MLAKEAWPFTTACTSRPPTSRSSRPRSSSSPSPPLSPLSPRVSPNHPPCHWPPVPPRHPSQSRLLPRNRRSALARLLVGRKRGVGALRRHHDASFYERSAWQPMMKSILNWMSKPEFCPSTLRHRLQHVQLLDARLLQEQPDPRVRGPRLRLSSVMSSVRVMPKSTDVFKVR